VVPKEQLQAVLCIARAGHGNKGTVEAFMEHTRKKRRHICAEQMDLQPVIQGDSLLRICRRTLQELYEKNSREMRQVSFDIFGWIRKNS
jgi:hypothetical protein